jgi:hypothetical protein
MKKYTNTMINQKNQERGSRKLFTQALLSDNQLGRENRAVRHFLLLASFFVCLIFGSVNIVNGQTNPSPDVSLAVGSITHMSVNGGTIAERLSAITAKIDLLLSEHPDVEVVLTPEYTFFEKAPKRHMRQTALDIDCDAGYTNCSLSAGGGVYSTLVLNTINTLRQKAIDAGVYMYLGTVVERVDASAIPGVVPVPADTRYNYPADTHPYVYYNTLLIIAPDGTMSIKRKTGLEYLSGCGTDTACGDSIRALSMNSVRTFDIVNRKGQAVEVFPIICYERTYTPMLDYAQALGIQDIKIALVPEREGDSDYVDINEVIQSGEWTPDNTGWGWSWGVKALFTDQLAGNRHIVADDAYVVFSEGGYALSAMFQIKEPPTPLAVYHRQPDNYVFGVIPVNATVTNINSSSDIPAEFELAQNHPNQFNPTTTIKYNLPKSAQVKIELFDMLGRKIKVLMNESRQAGTHNLTIDAGGLASGVYIYTLKSDIGYSAVKKMILMK